MKRIAWIGFLFGFIIGVFPTLFVFPHFFEHFGISAPQVVLGAHIPNLQDLSTFSTKFLSVPLLDIFNFSSNPQNTTFEVVDQHQEEKEIHHQQQQVQEQQEQQEQEQVQPSNVENL